MAVTRVPRVEVTRARLTLDDFLAIYEQAKIKWPEGKSPASFHEIRSLAARFYADQGVDAQALLGHKSPDMTAVYRDVRGVEWVSVRAV